MTKTIKLAIFNKGGPAYHVEVPAKVYGAWASHEDTRGLDYTVTFVRFGLAVPFLFEKPGKAEKACKEINALRSDWDELTADEVLSEAKAIIAICEKYGGVRDGGPKADRIVPVAEIPAHEAWT